ncbi:MAG TPA: hypothetical protein VH206_23730 [Xanthobacteraceae bacterium]|jgi:hypothetical protein|nr:hypothetical protein [Xanthobacteraceae bacterium]
MISRASQFTLPLATLAVGLMFCGLPTVAAAGAKKGATENASATSLVAEMRRSFTLRGKIIPPEIFRDFGDGDLADSGGIWVTIDVDAGIGSNLYYDPIREDGTWKSQRKESKDGNEETGYAFQGATSNGLLVVLASYNSGGTGVFYTLHILDVAAGAGFDSDGKRYQRINLTNIRSAILGDRWQGELKISGNAIRVITKRNGPGDAGARAPYTITAERP